MKHYKFGLAHKRDIELILPISDGQSFIFTFPASVYKKAKSIGISLYFNTHVEYRIFLEHPKAVLLNASSIIKFEMPAISDDDNIVLRVDKIFPSCFKTYINDQVVGSSSMSTVTNNHENRVDKAGVAIDTTDIVAVALTVFKYTEYGKVEAFTRTMRDPETNDFDIENDAGKESGNRDRAEMSTDGSNGPSPLSGPNVRPHDADMVKLSSTVAWPKAVSEILGSSVVELQKEHDKSMREWIVERGDGLSSNAYDYFVYSHGVAWPKTILEFNTDADFLKVLERHMGILKVLEDALNALQVQVR